uniref:t-SNARE coiled-coil homology domain-containing protein n=1 Tax=Glossina brevipalpis TaxID=37001 RepID=A0A1A9WGB3_9MUSC
MSHNLNNGASAPPPPITHRDYGATSTSTATGNSTLPEVNFSGFSPTEFMSLSEDIAHNVQTINSSCKQLEKQLKILGTPKDQQSVRTKVHNIHSKTNSRIEATSTDFKRLTAIVQRGDKQQKLQLEKLTNDFRSVVDKYLNIQKRMAAAMRKTYTQTMLIQTQDDFTNNENLDSERAELLQRQQQQQQVQFEHDLMVDRERQIKEIEADIQYINKIMHTMTGLMQTQGEEVDRIETSIENVAADVELGREQLAKASGRRQGYRRKMLILLAIAVIIGLIVTVIIVSKLTS